jgi:RNA polymerase sigma-70 factor (ECF subfamily)
MDGRTLEQERRCMVEDRSRDSAKNAGPVGRRPPESPLLGVFLRERERLRRIAAGLGMDRADADDVLQDVSVQVLKHTGPFEQEDVMIRWLIRVTVNRCLSEHRRRFRHKASRILRRRPELAEGLAENSGGAERASLGEELEVVRRTLTELNPELLLAVVLRYFCDMSSNEIADSLGWNASTVRGRLREARLLLAGKLLQRGIEP